MALFTGRAFYGSADTFRVLSRPSHSIVFLLSGNIFCLFITLSTRASIVLTATTLIGRALTIIAPLGPRFARPLRESSRFVAHFFIRIVGRRVSARNGLHFWRLFTQTPTVVVLILVFIKQSLVKFSQKITQIIVKYL